jgi:hypothetical protein
VADNKVAVGNTAVIPSPSPTTGGTDSIATKPTDLTVQAGGSLTGKIIPLNKDGAAASFKAKSIKITSSTVKLKAVLSVTDETVFTLTGVTAGDASLTISLISKSGATVKKVFGVKILPDADEAADIKVDVTPVRSAIFR